jgi:integrase
MRNQTNESPADPVRFIQANGLASATVVKAAQILGITLRAAVNDGRLARNPVDGLELPRIERAEPRFLTPAQIDNLASAIDGSYRALVMVGAYCGLRLGEMLALRRSRVDVLHRRIEVVATLYEIGGHLIENPPKTRAGHRSVPMPRVVAEAVSEHLAAVPGGPDDYLFRAPLGGPVRVAGWRSRFWTPACVRAGLGELVKVGDGPRRHYEGGRAHDLRHTAVALWIAAGASPKEIASRAGHSSVVTVLDRYGHLLPGTEEKVTDALDVLANEARSRDARGMDAEPVVLRSSPQAV